MAETAVEGYPKTLVEVSLGDGALTAVVRDVFVTWLLHAGVDDDDILGPLLDLNPPEEPTTGTARAVVLDMIQGALDAAVLKRVCTLLGLQPAQMVRVVRRITVEHLRSRGASAALVAKMNAQHDRCPPRRDMLECTISFEALCSTQFWGRVELSFGRVMTSRHVRATSTGEPLTCETRLTLIDARVSVDFAAGSDDDAEKHTLAAAQIAAQLLSIQSSQGQGQGRCRGPTTLAGEGDDNDDDDAGRGGSDRKGGLVPPVPPCEEAAQTKRRLKPVATGAKAKTTANATVATKQAAKHTNPLLWAHCAAALLPLLLLLVWPAAPLWPTSKLWRLWS